MEMLLLYLVLAVGFSFLCSILEAVLLSIPPSYIAAQSSAGTKRGAALSRLKADIDRPLSAILTLNTFAHTIGAAGVGAQAFEIWGEESLGVVSAVVTIIILIASEIIPKTIGAVYLAAAGWSVSGHHSSFDSPPLPVCLGQPDDYALATPKHQNQHPDPG